MRIVTRIGFVVKHADAVVYGGLPNPHLITKLSPK